MRNTCFCASYALLATLYAAFPAMSLGADPALTIYNQSFAVIRETLPLDLKAGDTVVRFSGATAQVEPDSVILRDPTGAHALRVVEQNYWNDPISQDRLLNLFEGKTIEFAAGNNPDGSPHIVATGKVIRSGYVPHTQAMNRYGPQYMANQYAMVSGGAGQPVIEVNGRLQFSLPGQPIFPSLGDDTILEPTLDWILHSDRAARFEAELSYVSGGLTWSSDYNIVAPEAGDTLDLVGWVTLDNQSGKAFDHAHIKLMAGDVNKVQPAPTYRFAADAAADYSGAPQVTERAFEDYHLYTLPQPTTLRDRETKQVEFLRASGIQSKRLYVYDGMAPDQGYVNQDLRRIQQYGTQSNPHVWVMREFVNSAANHLGMPLPKGRVRFYRRDQDGQMEFTGENQIDHTPKDETVRVYTGNAFDITGERRQTRFETMSSVPNFTDESFEIKLRNHNAEPVTVQVVEHLYRWATWAITQESAAHRQIDSKTIAYDVTLQPGEEKAITYTAHYTW
jgi:hypothetical protein